MVKITIAGNELDPKQDPILETLEEDDLELTQVIEVSRIRTAAKVVELKIEDEEDIIDALFEDGTEWIGSAKDFKEIFPEDELIITRGGDEVMWPSGVSDPTDRGAGVFIKVINLFRRKEKDKKKAKLTELAGRELGEWVDKKLCPEPGLFQLTRDFKLEPFQPDTGGSKKYFLFIHGTISNTENSFSKLRDFDTTGAWESIHNTFGNNVLALQHYTVSQSPLQNALDAMGALPDGAELMIMSGSRGGLVGDILAKCDYRNPGAGFLDLEIQTLKASNPEQAELADKLNQVIKKKIIVYKNIRVASPGAGTLILSERADHWLNGILRVIGLAFGGRAHVVYQLVRRFITKVIRSRTQTGVMPGLLAMIPGSYMVQLLNHPRNAASDQLFVIEGNAKFGKLGHTLVVIFARLFFREKNDFVVNTSSMRYGVRRSQGFHWYLSQDSQTHHLNYFKNPPTQKLIKEVVDTTGIAIPPDFTYSGLTDERGVVVRWFNLKEEKRKQQSGTKPIVILLPGIMGSHLYHGDDKIWIDFEAILKGKIRSELDISDDVNAESIVGNFYSDLVDHLEDRYDVYCFAYDWRRSLKHAADQLKQVIDQCIQFGKPIKILAHSMGGVVVRALMMNHPNVWKDFIQRDRSRFVMLGTPWYGSYLLVEVMTGRSNRVAQLALLDIKNSRRALMDTFLEYPGLYELLPIEETRPFELADPWDEIVSQVPNTFKPKTVLLDQFKKLKEDVFAHNFDFDQIYYVAGHSSRTTFDYRIRETLFSTRLQFLQTPRGDGSVTWEGGIPQGFPSKNLYYTHTEHSELANDPDLFQGISELLATGRTSSLSQTPPDVRGEDITVAPDPDVRISNEESEILDHLFGAIPVADKPIPAQEIKISLVHCDLEYGQYPVMVGHFDQDAIISGEAALDKYLDNKLKERYDLGKYPGAIKESEVILQLGKRPNGALVIGLGDNTDLTAYRLAETVEMGLISYAMFMRDHCSRNQYDSMRQGITSLFIGSGYGRLDLEDSIRAILKGIREANEKIIINQSNLRPITHLEFVEIYQDVVRQAYYVLRKIQREEKSPIINLVKDIEQRNGAQKRLTYKSRLTWWDSISSAQEVIYDKDGEHKVLEYTLSSGKARIEKQTLYPSESIINNLLKGFSPNTTWNKERAKTLFEMLIPRDFKDLIRNQNNIVWKVDEVTATYPWEMFHDYKIDEEPTFVNAGLIRQLVKDKYRPNPRLVRSRTALVIGDPDYEDMPEFQQLPAALKEAEFVNNLLKQQNFTVAFYRRSKGESILDGLFNHDYKILHIAGHGTYDPANEAIGPVLGKDMYLHSGILKNLDNVPEFVFINCCYSGEIGPPVARNDRYRLAANIGTTLIEMGVNAVVVAGWAVSDVAAELFARELYTRMLSGYKFGEAVQMARKKCYDDYSNDNTWGAYQCYGNPWYKLTKDDPTGDKDAAYVTPQEVEVDLYNLLVRTKRRRNEAKSYFVDELQLIMEKAYQSNRIDGRILELEAKIYAYLEEIDLSLERYTALLNLNRAEYSVKALEQYVLMQLEHLARKPKPTLREINACLKEIESVILISKTAERLSIQGLAYQKFALARPDKRMDFLDKMFKSYLAAYNNAGHELNYEIGALCSLLIADYLADDRTTRLLNDEKINAAESLKQARNKLRTRTGLVHEFILNWLSVRLHIAEMVISRDQAHIQKLNDEVRSWYQEIWKLGGTFHFIQTELDHLKFLIKINPRKVSRAKRDAFRRLSDYLNTWSAPLA